MPGEFHEVDDLDDPTKAVALTRYELSAGVAANDVGLMPYIGVTMVGTDIRGAAMDYGTRHEQLYFLTHEAALELAADLVRATEQRPS